MISFFEVLQRSVALEELYGKYKQEPMKAYIIRLLVDQAEDNEMPKELLEWVTMHMLSC